MKKIMMLLVIAATHIIGCSFAGEKKNEKNVYCFSKKVKMQKCGEVKCI